MMNNVGFLKSKVLRTKNKIKGLLDQLKNYEELLEQSKKGRKEYYKKYLQKKKDENNVNITKTQYEKELFNNKKQR